MIKFSFKNIILIMVLTLFSGNQSVFCTQQEDRKSSFLTNFAFQSLEKDTETARKFCGCYMETIVGKEGAFKGVKAFIRRNFMKDNPFKAPDIDDYQTKLKQAQLQTSDEGVKIVKKYGEISKKEKIDPKDVDEMEDAVNSYLNACKRNVENVRFSLPGIEKVKNKEGNIQQNQNVLIISSLSKQEKTQFSHCTRNAGGFLSKRLTSQRNEALHVLAGKPLEIKTGRNVDISETSK